MSFPVGWEDLGAVKPSDFTVRTVPGLLSTLSSWSERLPEPRPLPEDLVAEGHAIPVARVLAGQLGGECVQIADLTAGGVADVVRSAA